MKEGLNNMKLLAFVCLIKHRVKNSVLPFTAAYKNASFLGIAPVTYNKLRNRLIELELINGVGKHQQLVGLSKCIQVIFKNDTNFLKGTEFSFKQFKYVRFFQETKEMDLKEIEYYISYAISELNFKQQQYKYNQVLKRLHTIDYYNNRTKCSNYQAKKNAIKWAKSKTGMDSTEESVKELLKRSNERSEIITGAKHLSNILNCSPATAINRLNTFQKNGLIDRKPIYEKVMGVPFSHEGWDMIKKMHPKMIIIPSKKNQCFYLSKGSQITLLK